MVNVVWEEVGKTLTASFLIRKTQKKSDTYFLGKGTSKILLLWEVKSQNF